MNSSALIRRDFRLAYRRRGEVEADEEQERRPDDEIPTPGKAERAPPTATLTQGNARPEPPPREGCPRRTTRARKR